MNPMVGRRGLWLRQFGDTNEANSAPNVLTGIRRIAATLKDYTGGSFLALKVADGEHFVGSYDSGSPINSVDDVAAMQALLRFYDIELVPVVVPRGSNITAESDLHGAIANRIGSLMTDIEPYASFFDGGTGREPSTFILANIPHYCRMLRDAAGPNAFLVNQPDPREHALQSAHVERVCEYFDALSPQFYVGWHEVGWLDVPNEVTSYRRIQTFGLPVHVTLWGLGRTDLAGRFWDLIRNVAPSVHAFTMGNMNAEQLRWFGSLLGPEAQPEKPDTGNGGNATLVDDLTAIINGFPDMEAVGRNLLDRLTIQYQNLVEVRGRLHTG